MTRQAIIERTIKAINQLPEDKAEEISDFADFVIKKFEENRITKTIQQLASNSLHPCVTYQPRSAHRLVHRAK